MPPTLLIHHAARRGHRHPPGSLAALRACLAAGARFVEIDVLPVADGDFALLHDGELDRATDGVGVVFSRSSAEISRLHYRQNGQVTGEQVGLLSQAVALLQTRPDAALQELQLDLKPDAPLSVELLRSLLNQVEPVQQRIRVSSGADWALRGLRALDPGLALGFDPLLYLDIDAEGKRDEDVPPLHMGAYGYRDDHPLASRRWGPPAAYLAARAEALAAQAPAGGVWYIDAHLLARVLEDGFDWVGYLHTHGVQVTAWTLDPDRPGHLDLARRLIEVGVDRITTNDPPGLAAALGDRVAY